MAGRPLKALSKLIDKSFIKEFNSKGKECYIRNGHRY